MNLLHISLNKCLYEVFFVLQIYKQPNSRRITPLNFTSGLIPKRNRLRLPTHTVS